MVGKGTARKAPPPVISRFGRSCPGPNGGSGPGPRSPRTLLTPADVYGTDYHAAHLARITPGDSVTVVGGGAVGLLAVLSAKPLGDQGITKVRDLTGGHGTRAVLERAFDHTLTLEQTPEGYRAMGHREAL
ncbi:hypothetical protein [Streptomyces sp. NBC_01763]|uniref:hypothetical protein n=1 Tax=Streptomyces sp. NBC_01763 TaxID=2975934 RepID=UPI002DDAB6E7|nr:hypothetical protein [Streptomyces sp. NBC_01763]WSC35355.1 hypothetical protein OHA08_07465 [Streptomyces sp. NBC_01763]